MDRKITLKGWNDLQPPCGLTGKTIQDGDYVVWFPYFITDKDDPFWRYNEWPMLREAFDGWEHKEAFLTRWHRFLLTNATPRVLVNQAGYLIRQAESTSVIVVHFLAHGFQLNIPKESWNTFKDLLLKAPLRSGGFGLPNKGRVLIGVEGEKIKVALEPPPTFKGGRRDRILLNHSEWRSLKELLKDIDRIL